ncbi:MAG TPA: thiamine pyrophosphate-binding protein [Candidatus Tectomicrobia bacterium]|jgi:thiamine pyrophosphate-dependent acetolactate synthase large subunit-like protein
MPEHRDTPLVTTPQAPRRPQYGSDVIVDLLRACGIAYAACNPGATFRGLHDSLVNYGGNHLPELIQCCHEEISVAIAHGYAKATGKPMASLIHNIVGLQHASMAIFNAWCDRVPLLALGATGPMDITQRRPWIDWIHTALVQGNLVRDYVKWDDQPHNLASVPESFLRAHRIALTEPQGPVYVCYDAGLQEEVVHTPVPLPDPQRYGPPAPPQANPAALERAADLLVQAQYPLIIADLLGRHPEAVPHLVQLAELLAIPVVDRGGRFNFSNTHPLNLTDALGELLPQADVVLALDVLDLFGILGQVDRATRRFQPAISPQTTVIHLTMGDLFVRSWAGDYERLPAVDLPMAADTAVALPHLLELCRSRLGQADTARLAARAAHFQARHHALRQQWQQVARNAAQQRPMAVPTAVAAIWEVLQHEDWVLVNNAVGAWTRRLWDWQGPGCYLGTSGGAGLGYGMGAALGGALAYRNTGKLCVNLQADGDLLYTPSALWTAAHHRLPMLVIMFNNRSYYNSEEHALELARVRERPLANAGIGTRLDDPPVNFAQMAQSFGLYGAGPVDTPEAIRPALERALRVVKDEARLALVDIVMQPR